MTLRFEHLTAFTLSEVSTLPATTGLATPQTREGVTVAAQFVVDLDLETFHADRECALRNGLLKYTFQAVHPNLDAEIEELRAQRKKAHPNKPSLVIRVCGPADFWKPKFIIREKDFSFGRDLFSKDEIRGVSMPFAEAVVATLGIALPFQRHVKTVDSIYCFDETGHAYYSTTISGEASLTAVHAWSEREILSFFELAGAALRLQGMERVLRLYCAALSDATEPFRQFVTAWTALEVLINKLFRTYEERFIQEARLVTRVPPGVLDRIQEVMADKYRMTDKFAIVASYLRPTECDSDLEALKLVKRTRDDLLHGENIRDDQLPIQVMLTLLGNYVAAYLRAPPEGSTERPG